MIYRVCQTNEQIYKRIKKIAKSNKSLGTYQLVNFM